VALAALCAERACPHYVCTSMTPPRPAAAVCGRSMQLGPPPSSGGRTLRQPPRTSSPSCLFARDSDCAPSEAVLQPRCIVYTLQSRPRRAPGRCCGGAVRSPCLGRRRRQAAAVPHPPLPQPPPAAAARPPAAAARPPAAWPPPRRRATAAVSSERASLVPASARRPRQSRRRRQQLERRQGSAAWRPAGRRPPPPSARGQTSPYRNQVSRKNSTSSTMPPTTAKGMYFLIIACRK